MEMTHYLYYRLRLLLVFSFLQLKDGASFCSPLLQLRTKTKWAAEPPWSVGNVYQDMDRLEVAIRKTQAENQGARQLRKQQLDYMAMQRRSVADDLSRTLTPCILVSALLCWVFRKLPQCHTVLQLLSRIHYVLVLVLLPLWLLMIRPRQPPQTTDDLDGWDKSLTQQAEKQSCRDFAVCLLEQWLTATISVGILGWFRPSWLPVGRIAALASLHQYESLWFQLINSPRPRRFVESVMLSYRSSFYTKQIVCLELALWLSNFSASLPVYAACAALTAVLGPVVRALPSPGSNAILDRVWQFRPPIKLLAKSLGLAMLYQRRKGILKLLQWVRKHPLSSVSVPMSGIRIKWGSLVRTTFVLFALVGPLCHLVSFLRLIKVSYMHNLSLSQPDSVKFNGAQRCWRYNIRWREPPKRIKHTLRDWNSAAWHWYFMSGTVDFQLQQANARAIESELEARLQGIMRQAAYETQFNLTRPKQVEWKERVMKLNAEKHKQEYDTKNKEDFDDPLGVSVYRAFDIGLTYDFDHDSALGENETPTTWRLQARAAKSAIRHAHRLYNTNEASSTTKEIKDPEDIPPEIKREVESIAKRLSDLIPTDFETLEFTHEREQLQDFSQLLNQRSPVVDFLLQNHLRKTQNTTTVDDEIEYLDPMANADDDYLAAWQARYQNGKNSTFTDEEGDPELHLC